MVFLIAAGISTRQLGQNGRISDGGVLKRSKFELMLDEGLLNLPDPEPLPGISITND